MGRTAIRAQRVPSSVRPLPPPRPSSRSTKNRRFLVKKKSLKSRAEKLAQILEELAIAKSKEDMAASRQLRSRGRISELFKRLEQTVECLREAGGRTEEARRLYIARWPELQEASASKQFSRALKVLETIFDGD